MVKVIDQRLYKLPENDKQRLKLYDEIFFKALKKRILCSTDANMTTLNITIYRLKDDIALAIPFDWFNA